MPQAHPTGFWEVDAGRTARTAHWWSVSSADPGRARSHCGIVAAVDSLQGSKTLVKLCRVCARVAGTGEHP